MNYSLNSHQSQRLLFRDITIKDATDWLPFFEDPSTSRYWVQPKVPAKQACDHWYERQLFRYNNGLGGHNALIEKVSNRFIGHCGLLVQTVDGIQELEIGYSLLPEFWNKGYATEAALACRDFAFENEFGKEFGDSLISIISTSNLPSQSVAKKNSMDKTKRTIYSNNEVDIWRINFEKWKALKNEARLL